MIFEPLTGTAGTPIGNFRFEGASERRILSRLSVSTDIPAISK